MASKTIILHNTNKTFAREVFSSDGDSVHIMAGSKQPVDPKFSWNLPKDVVEFGDYETVFAKKKNPEDEQKIRERNVTAKTGNTVNPEDVRPTVVTDEKQAVVKK